MNGIILIDKPKEYTSHDIVAIVKKISQEKVGHTGTLDPMATGVLPLLIGKATGLSKYLINHDKTYITTVKLGIKTDTADAEGIVVKKESVPKIMVKKESVPKIIQLSEEKVKNILKSMIGMQEQIPPMYSAIKVNGKKLYEYARKGQTVEVKGRIIEVYDMKLISLNKEEAEITFEISCSKGTYIRTICEDLAEKLETVGYMKDLRRTRVGTFKIENSIDIEKIKNDSNLLINNIISIENFFENKEKIDLNNKELKLFLNGVQLEKSEKNDLYKIYNNNKFIGLGVIEDNKLKRDIIVEE